MWVMWGGLSSFDFDCLIFKIRFIIFLQFLEPFYFEMIIDSQEIAMIIDSQERGPMYPSHPLLTSHITRVQ